MFNFIIVQVFIPFFMVVMVLKWSILPSRASVCGSYFHTSCTSWSISSIFLDLCKLRCLWVDKLIFILSCSLHYKFLGVTLIAFFCILLVRLSKVISSLVASFRHWSLIALLVNAFQGSITSADGVLYLASHSSILVICGIVYCTFLKYEITPHHLQTTILPLLHFFCIFLHNYLI